MRPGRWALLGVAALLVAGAAVGVAVTRDEARTSAPQAGDAPELARSACRAVGQVLALIEANGSSERVRELMDDAASAAGRAADADARWVQLSTSVRNLRQGIRDDDGALAGTATALLVPLCRELGNPVQPGPATPYLPPIGGGAGPVASPTAPKP